MMFLGARGTTSWQMNELLRFDEMISFNPHLLFKNVTEALSDTETAACVKQLFVDQVTTAGQLPPRRVLMTCHYLGAGSNLSSVNRPQRPPTNRIAPPPPAINHRVPDRSRIISTPPEA